MPLYNCSKLNADRWDKLSTTIFYKPFPYRSFEVWGRGYTSVAHANAMYTKVIELNGAFLLFLQEALKGWRGR